MNLEEIKKSVNTSVLSLLKSKNNSVISNASVFEKLLAHVAPTENFIQ